MTQCPIAHWKQHRANSLAFSSMTYGELNELVVKFCYRIEKIPEKILAFIPITTIGEVAFCFAAWRCNKALFPLNRRLPPAALSSRIDLTKAALVSPNELALTKSLICENSDEHACATLLETSSSSKIVCHSLFSHQTSAKSCAKALDLFEGDRYCFNLPLFHISGMALMIRTFTAGATLLFPAEIDQATHVSMVPTQLYRLLHRDHPLPNAKCLLIGGAPLSASLSLQAEERGLPIYTTYGMTEVASMALVKKGNSPAKVLEHIQLSLGEDNEILLRGPSLMSGYFGKPPQKEWFHTRDIGHIDELGELTIVGRKDRQFISGGVNIQPEEIEKALLELNYVIQAKVRAVEDSEYGMRPTAEVYCTRDSTQEEIQSDLAHLLPRYKIPRKILLETDLLKFAKIPQN